MMIMMRSVGETAQINDVKGNSSLELNHDDDEDDDEEVGDSSKDTTRKVTKVDSILKAKPRYSPNHVQSLSPRIETKEATIVNQASTPEHSCTGRCHGGKGGQCSGRLLLSSFFGAIVVVLLALCVYLFTEWLTIPGLKAQINRLEADVVRLEANADELTRQIDLLDDRVNHQKNETDRYATINHDLLMVFSSCSQQNDGLNVSLSLSADLNGHLNATILHLEAQVILLESQVNELMGQIRQLENTTDQLGSEVNRLENETDRCSVLNDRLLSIVTNCTERNDRLYESLTACSNLGDQLNTTVLDLEANVSHLELQVDELLEQIDEFTVQMDLLGGEVDRLENKTNEYDVLNNQLELSVSNCSQRNNRLSASLVVSRGLSDQLNDTVMDLEAQVIDLETQVASLEVKVNESTALMDRLEQANTQLAGEVDRLENETDRYALLNGQLRLTVSNYSQQNNRLNRSLIAYEHLNDQLNATVYGLSTQNSILQQSLQDYGMLNDDLNATANRLSQQVVRLQVANNELNDINNALENTVEALSNQTATLSAVNDGLNATIGALQREMVDLVTEIDRLHNLSTSLATLVSFLNETAINTDETMDDVADFLASEINKNRLLAMDSLRNLYNHRISFWGCDFREHFLTEPFVQNRDSPVGSVMFSEVMDFVEDRVLNDLCLSRLDFIVYLTIQTTGSLPPVGVSFNEIVRAVGSYTDLAMAYYFPAPGRAGLTASSWGEAHYNCNNLSSELTYTHTL